MEDLECLVRVERDDDLRDRSEVPVHERAQSPAVLDGTAARSSGHEELEPGRAKRVLDVDGEQADAPPAVCGRNDGVFARPGLRVSESCGVVDPPDLADPVEVGVARNGKLVEHRDQGYVRRRLKSWIDGDATVGRARCGRVAAVAVLVVGCGGHDSRGSGTRALGWAASSARLGPRPTETAPSW
jgi:hypothetical protein